MLAMCVVNADQHEACVGGPAGRRVAGRDLQHAAFIERKRNIHLHTTARTLGQTGELDFAKQCVAIEAILLALTDADSHHGLVVPCRGERSGIFTGDRAVAFDQLVHIAADYLYSEREGSDVEQ